jgi:hypothetical protein
VDAVFESLPDSSAIRRYRAHQSRTGAVEVQIEVDPARKLNVDLEQLKRTLGALLEGCPIHIDVTTLLRASASSKHRAITSELTAADLSSLAHSSAAEC